MHEKVNIHLLPCMPSLDGCLKFQYARRDSVQPVGGWLPSSTLGREIGKNVKLFLSM